MPVHFCDPDRGSLSSTSLHIDRDGQTITGVVQLHDGTVALLTKNAGRIEERAGQDSGA